MNTSMYIKLSIYIICLIVVIILFIYGNKHINNKFINKQDITNNQVKLFLPGSIIIITILIILINMFYSKKYSNI